MVRIGIKQMKIAMLTFNYFPLTGGAEVFVRETGFIIKDNSPEGIARDILAVLSRPDLEEVTRRAQALVEKEHNYLAAVDRYRRLLDTL